MTSRQSMFEPAASVSVLRLSHDEFHLPLERKLGKCRRRRPAGARLAQFFAELGVERRQPGNVDYVTVADTEIIRRAGLERGNVDDSFFHDAGRAGES